MQNKQPNLIYVYSDQLRYSSVGFDGDVYAYTPNMDKFACECTVCDNVISGHPVCAPYSASLFTGKYNTSTGMAVNEIRINPCSETFAEVLDKNGYETCFIGKWRLYAAQLGRHFNAKNSFIPRGEDRLGFNDYFAVYNFHRKYFKPDAYYYEETPDKNYVDGYAPDAQTDMAMANIKRLKECGKPFALFLSLGTPHGPWNKDNVPEKYYDLFKDRVFPIPDNYSDKNDSCADGWAKMSKSERKNLNEWKRVYYAMVANLDYNFGRLTKFLHDESIFENTIFVFTSDHGEMFGAHGRRAENIFYDEAVRVPFLLKCGAAVEKNETVVNTVDIMPTLLSLMRLPVPDGVDGKDKSKYIMTEEKEDDNAGALLIGTGAAAMWRNGCEWRGWRTRRYTYAVYKKDLKEFLFDNKEDPYQTINLAENAAYSKVHQRMEGDMYAKMKEIGDGFENNSYYKKNWLKRRVINK